MLKKAWSDELINAKDQLTVHKGLTRLTILAFTGKISNISRNWQSGQINEELAKEDRRFFLDILEAIPWFMQ